MGVNREALQLHAVFIIVPNKMTHRVHNIFQGSTYGILHLQLLIFTSAMSAWQCQTVVWYDTTGGDAGDLFE